MLQRIPMARRGVESVEPLAFWVLIKDSAPTADGTCDYESTKPAVPGRNLKFGQPFPESPAELSKTWPSQACKEGFYRFHSEESSEKQALNPSVLAVKLSTDHW